jgi:hypothetical protein
MRIAVHQGTPESFPIVARCHVIDNVPPEWSVIKGLWISLLQDGEYRAYNDIKVAVQGFDCCDRPVQYGAQCFLELLLTYFSFDLLNLSMHRRAA